MAWRSDITIGAHRVALDAPTYFIADIAANHDGELARAKALIHLAKQAGADCAKFQHFEAGKIVSGVGFAQMGGQQAHQAGWKRSVVEVYDHYHTRRAWTDELVATCAEVGVDYMTTPYDFEAVRTQAPHVPAFKIGSGDITWLDLIAEVAGTGKPVLLANRRRGHGRREASGGGGAGPHRQAHPAPVQHQLFRLAGQLRLRQPAGAADLRRALAPAWCWACRTTPLARPPCWAPWRWARAGGGEALHRRQCPRGA